MYGLIITATGWTWEYVDENMTMPRLEELREYWTETPPVHVCVAAYLLDKGGKSKEKPLEGDAGVGYLMSLFPSKGNPHG